jgi:hypothetical protein
MHLLCAHVQDWAIRPMGLPVMPVGNATMLCVGGVTRTEAEAFFDFRVAKLTSAFAPLPLDESGDGSGTVPLDEYAAGDTGCRGLG